MNTVQNPTGKVSGWLHARRQMKGFSFLIIRNRHGLTQVDASDSVCSCLADCHLETVVEIEGNWVAQKDGVRELQATHITVISRVAEPPPVAINHPNLEASLPVSLDEATHKQRADMFIIPNERIAFIELGRKNLVGLGNPEEATSHN